MRASIVGAGLIGHVHGPIILKQPKAEVVGIVDKEIKAAEGLAKKLNARHVYQDVEAMIKEQKPDIVHVLTPPQTHAEISSIAMNYGCHVLVEKPMALTVSDSKKMIETAKKNNVYLCVDHNALFENVFQNAKKLIDGGAIGELVSVEAIEAYDASRNPAMIEDGAETSHWSYKMKGGPLQDMIPHPISLILEFLPEIKEVHCTGLNRGLLPKNWYDEIRVILKSDTITGFMSVTLSQKPAICSLNVNGTKGIIHVDYHNLIYTVRKQSSLPRKINRGLDGFHISYQYLKGAVGNIFNTAFGKLDLTTGIGTSITKIYESIRNGTEPPVSMEKGLAVVELMDRIWPSSTEDGNDN